MEIPEVAVQCIVYIYTQLNSNLQIMEVKRETIVFSIVQYCSVLFSIETGTIPHLMYVCMYVCKDSHGEINVENSITSC